VLHITNKGLNYDKQVTRRKLENFRSLTNAQYAELLSFIELDDIF
jgi:hypothetical protein